MLYVFSKKGIQKHFLEVLYPLKPNLGKNAFNRLTFYKRKLKLYMKLK